MNTVRHLTLPLRRQHTQEDAAGYILWETVTESRTIPVDQAALVLCDVWDRNWCRGANERLAPMLPRMNHIAAQLRDAGMLIVHAPSETMDFYADMPARRRVLDAPTVTPPAPLPHVDPPLPIDDSDGGCDTPPDFFDTLNRPWKRQDPAIHIDQDRDAISDSGSELYSLYRQRGINTVLFMGVHVNMCILARPFAIKPMVRIGIDTVLIRDLTDSMYNPAKRPYVSHETGTGLVVDYIEKFWCPTVTSAQVLEELAR
ncbi:MAG: isochorismatase hydrolase [Chloroflexi bacterium]|nr:isochorismatase hydrolase [Chloroflexota bacterium]